jgi:HAE1 family hydrophobic/amphiphilic exporter-1
MELKVAYDSTVDIIDDNRETIINIIFGIALTTLILFFFMGSLRVTIVAAIVIPTSLVSAFLLMDVSKFTINMMTLLAIATCLGTLIANAVVVIESVVEYLERGYNSVDAAVLGTKDVAVAVLASAGTNLVVFTPIGFMGGIIGQFMKQFGMTVVYATIFSIIASFSLTPMLCAVMLKKGVMKKSKGIAATLTRWTNSSMKFVLKEYRIVFDLIMNNMWKSFVIISILIVAFLVYPAMHLGSEFFSKSDESMIKAMVTLPQGVTLDKTRQVVGEVEKIVKTIPELRDYLSTTGVNGAEKGHVIIRLKDKGMRSRSDVEIIRSLIPEIAKIPEAEITLQRGGGGGPGGAGDITINVYGKNYEKLISLSKEMTNVMKASGYFRSIDSSYKNPKREIRFIPDDEKMTRYGLKNRDIGSTLRLSVAGNDSNIYKEDGQEYKINLELDEKFKSSIEDIKNINIITKDGLFPMSELGTIKYAKAYPTIDRRDKVRIIKLNGYLSKSTAGQVEKILKTKFKEGIKFEQGYGYRYAGSAEFMGETVSEIQKAFILAVILTYMLLVAILNSFSFPFVILTSVFTSVVGVVLLLFFAEFTVNIGSMMSIVMLVGLAVNNAILMIDYSIRMLREGKELRESIWMGVEAKFRTILMTSIAIIVGALPQVLDPSITKASMGGVIVGGILGSIVFTFIYIPIIFYGFEYMRFKFFGSLFVPKKAEVEVSRVNKPTPYDMRPDA